MQDQLFAESSPGDGDIARDNPSTVERSSEVNDMTSTADTRRRSTRIAAIDANIEAAPQSQTRPKPTSSRKKSLPAPPKQLSAVMAEYIAATPYQQDLYDDASSNAFVDHILAKLQRNLEKVTKIRADKIRSATQLDEIHRTLLIDGRDSLRSIYSAWSKYPRAGGTMDGALISLTDYRYTAHHVVRDSWPGENNDSLVFKIAKSLANIIDRIELGISTVVHEQKRINDCLLAIRKQYILWQTELDPEKVLTMNEAHNEMIADPAKPVTYTISGVRELNPRTTPAYMLSSKGIAASAEEEEHDNVHVYVSGGKVLKTKQQKIGELTTRINEAKVAEAKQAKDALAAARAAKTRPVRKTNPPLPIDYEEITVALPRKVDSVPQRKRAAAAVDADRVNDAEGVEGTPVPTKRAKKTTGKGKGAVQESKESTPASNGGSPGSPPGSGGFGTVAPDMSKKGGAAPKWLEDEDDLGRQLINDNPQWPMPAIYREFNAQLANTAYQATDKDPVRYRSDWIEFPRTAGDGSRMYNDKEARKNDICWRSYESVRQHLEDHKAATNNDTIPKPLTWVKCKPNLAANLPKRAPPPRPTYFKDAKTPVAPARGARAVDTSSLSELTSGSTPDPRPQTSLFTIGSPTSFYGGREYHMNAGWTAINNPTSGDYTGFQPPAPAIGHKTSRKPKARKEAAHPSLGAPQQQQVVFSAPETSANPSHLRSSPPPAEPALPSIERPITYEEAFNAQYPPVEQSAPGDALYDTLEDFVMDMSDGEEEEEEDNDKENEPPAATTYSAEEVANIVAAAMRPMEERLAQLEAQASSSPRLVGTSVATPTPEPFTRTIESDEETIDTLIVCLKVPSLYGKKRRA